MLSEKYQMHDTVLHGELTIDQKKIANNTILVETMRIIDKEFLVHVTTTPGCCQLEAVSISLKTPETTNADITGCVTVKNTHNPALGRTFMLYDSSNSDTKVAETRVLQRDLEQNFLNDGELTLSFDLRVNSRVLPTVSSLPDPKDLICRLLAPHSLDSKCPLTQSEVNFVCAAAGRVVMQQPVVLFVGTPVNICGDIHGMFADLVSIFLEHGFPGNANYLFLGNLVDVGSDGVDVVLLLLLFKILYPENIFILRGNHECDYASVRRGVEFKNECKEKGLDYQSFLDLFACLPVAAVVSGSIFCVHGGLSPLLSQIACVNFKRPQQTPGGGMVSDMIWSNFSHSVEHFEISADNKMGCLVGRAAVEKFLTSSSLNLIVRGSTNIPSGGKVGEGFELTLENVITLRSSGVGGAVHPYAIMSVRDNRYRVHLGTPITNPAELFETDFRPHLPFGK